MASVCQSSEAAQADQKQADCAELHPPGIVAGPGAALKLAVRSLHRHPTS
jgi:hypothetical protein